VVFGLQEHKPLQVLTAAEAQAVVQAVAEEHKDVDF
jgi:hypothetical protein